MVYVFYLMSYVCYYTFIFVVIIYSPNLLSQEPLISAALGFSGKLNTANAMTETSIAFYRYQRVGDGVSPTQEGAGITLQSSDLNGNAQ